MNEKMKAIKLIIPTLMLCLPFSFCFAETISLTSPIDATEFPELLNTVAGFLFNLGLALAPLSFLVAAFFLLTAAGNPKNIETAKNIAIYTLLGLLILLLARGIIAVVYGIVGEEALDIGIIIGRIFTYMFWLLLMSSALSFLLSAYYFLMGGENEEYRKMGKSVLIFTIVAIVLAILSRGIAEFVVRIVSS